MNSVSRVLKILLTVIIIFFFVINLFFLSFGSVYNWTESSLTPHIYVGLYISSAAIGYSVYSCFKMIKPKYRDLQE